MNIRSFVGASSAVLLAWLGATYLHEVSPERYPKLDRTAASVGEKENAEIAVAEIGSTQR